MMSGRFPGATVIVPGFALVLLMPLWLIAQAPAAQKPAADPQAKSEAVAEVDGVPITNDSTATS